MASSSFLQLLFYNYLMWLSVWEKREYNYIVVTLFYADRFENSFQFSSQLCGGIDFEPL
jgi:hypothetical protein